MALIKDQKYILFMNMCSAMGYSLVAPLLPSMCKERNISSKTCSLLISIMALSQAFTTIYFPKIVMKYGRQKLLFLSLFIQTLITIFYGIMNYINKNFYFILTGFICRVIHGIVSCNINSICFFILSMTNKDLDWKYSTGYIELSSMMGETIGPIVVSIFYDIGGYSLPYYICALICLFSVYVFFQVPQVDETLFKKEKVEKISTNNENIMEKKEKKDLLILLNLPQMLLLTGCIIMKTNSIDFYLPTLVNHLNESWNVSISIASLFFLSPIISNAIILQKIHNFIFIGNFLIISLGLFLTGITSFIIAPINFLPHSYWTILTGIFIMGINGCLIVVPTFIELNNYSRTLYPYSIEMQNYVRNFFFRFSFQIADFISPILGSFFYTHYSFEASAYFTGFITLFFWLIFYFYYKDQIKLFFTQKNLEENTNNAKQSNIIPSTDIN